MNTLKFIIVTILFMWLAHYIAAFPHEYSHSIMAWLLGYKVHALNIDYGGKSIGNILLLLNINENNNYYLMYLLGARHAIALVAFAGPGIANGGMYLLSLYCLLKVNVVKHCPYLYYFIFWINLMSLGNLYDYVPIRTFSTHGDVGHILFGLNNLSPWWVFIPVGYIVLSLVYYFFSNTLLKAYHFSFVDTTFKKIVIMLLCVFMIFFYFATPAMSGGYGVISQFISDLSFAIIPAMIFICWPTRRWVTNTLRSL